MSAQVRGCRRLNRLSALGTRSMSVRDGMVRGRHICSWRMLLLPKHEPAVCPLMLPLQTGRHIAARCW